MGIIIQSSREEIKKNLPEAMKTVPWWLRWTITSRWMGIALRLRGVKHKA